MKKSAFVTGAGYGTGGYAIAERFAKEGYDVFVTSRRKEEAENSAAKLMESYDIFAKGYELNAGDEQAVIETFKDIDSQGRFVEIICFNAANLGFGTDPAEGMILFDTSIKDFKEVIDTNIVWNFMMVKQAAIRMREQGKGSIVWISSNSAVRPNPNRVAYIASKGGINSMSKALAVDLGQYGIRSNVIMPGTIKTQRWVKMGDRQISNGEMTPLGDISDFEDIANTAWFLGSDESKNITGAEIVVDGGMSCQIYPQLLNKYKKADIERKLAEK